MDGTLRPSAYLFDLYGTLLVFADFDKTHQLWLEALHDLVGEAGNFSLEESAAMGNRILHSRARGKPTELSTYEGKMDLEFRRLGISVSRARLREIADRTLAAWQRGIKLADDAKHVLAELRVLGLRTALITNFDHGPHVRQLLAALGLGPLFDAIFISDEVGSKKPDSRIFRSALRQLGVAAEDAVHVGDSVHDDVQGARGVGIEPILIDRQMKSNEDERHPTQSVSENLPKNPRVIRSLSELVARTP